MHPRSTAALFFTLLTGCAGRAGARHVPSLPESSAARTPVDGPRHTDLATPVVDVPLTKIGDFYYLDVRLNGRPFRLTLETGAGFFAISTRAATALGLPAESIEVVPGMRAPVVTIESLALNGATFRGLRAQVSRTFDGQAFDGIVSIPVLRDLLATVDLGANRLRLTRGELPAPNGRDVLAVAGRDRGGRIDVAVDLGGVTVPAVLDTRSSIWIIAPDSLEPRLRLAAPARAVATAMGPSLGSFTLRGARLVDDLRVGQFTVERPAVMLRNRPGVVVGVPLLEQFAVTIDQRNGRVRFARPGRGDGVPVPPVAWETTDAASTPDGPRVVPAVGAPKRGDRIMGFGLSGSPGGGLTVVNVFPGSDAERVGLRAGDQLVALDGTSVAEMNPGVMRAAAARAAAVRVVVMRVGRRIEVDVTPFLVP